MIPAVHLGWVAGVLDLRGRIGFKNNATRHGTRQVTLFVESKEYQVIQRLARLTGTKPDLRPQRPLKDFMRRNCAEHCPEQHVHVGDDFSLAMPPMARWTVTGSALVIVLDNVLPYTEVNHDDWVAAAEEADAGASLNGRGAHAVLSSVRRLQALGWEIPARYEHALTTTEIDVAEPTAA